MILQRHTGDQRCNLNKHSGVYKNETEIHAGDYVFFPVEDSGGDLGDFVSLCFFYYALLERSHVFTYIMRSVNTYSLT